MEFPCKPLSNSFMKLQIKTKTSLICTCCSSKHDPIPLTLMRVKPYDH